MRKIKSLFEDLEVGIELAEEDPSMEEHVESIIGEISRRLRDLNWN